MTYNEIIQQAGKRISIVVYYIVNGTTTTLNEDNVGKIKLYTKSNLIGTAITGCDIETKELLDGDVYVQINASYQEHSASKTYGPYYIKEQPKYDANKKNYTYTLYDGMIKSMTNYKVPQSKNLFDEVYTDIQVGNQVTYKPIEVGDGTFTMSSNIPTTPTDSYANLFLLSGNVTSGASTGDNGVYLGRPITTQSIDGYVTIGYRVLEDTDPRQYQTMLQEGSQVTTYEPYGDIVYPMTLYDYFKKVCETIGYTTNIASLPNGSQVLNAELYADIDYTFRGVLDDIAGANGVLFYIDGNEVKIAQKEQNTISINDDTLKNQNIDFGQHFGPINSVVLSRSAESDNIYERDEESIEENGLHEFKIKDNEILNSNDRNEYIHAIATQLFDTEYDIYDTELTGYGDIGLFDKVEFETGNNTYTSYIFNNEITLTTGYKQVIYNEMPEQSETDYKKADKEDNLIKQAYIIVDKQNQTINSVVQTVGEYDDKISAQNETIKGIGTQVTQTLEGIETRVTSVEGELEDGVKLVKTTSVTINDAGLTVSTDTSKISTVMSNDTFSINSSNKQLAKFGYDTETGKTVAQMDNLTVEKYLIAGYHRAEKYDVDYKHKTGIFYIGG